MKAAGMPPQSFAGIMALRPPDFDGLSSSRTARTPVERLPTNLPTILCGFSWSIVGNGGQPLFDIHKHRARDDAAISLAGFNYIQ